MQRRQDDRAGPRLSRRGFMGLAAASIASGCIYSHIRAIPRTAARWPVFRFAAVGRLSLAHSGPADEFRFAHDAAVTIRSMPDLDFVLAADALCGDCDHHSHMMADEIVRESGIRWYCSPSPHHEIRGVCKKPSPYAVSPVQGVVVAGLSPVDDMTMDSAAPFLSETIEENAGDFVIVVLPEPVRKPEKHEGAITGSGAETLKYMLDAAQEVRIVVSASEAPPFVHQHSGLLHVCMPPPAEFPHVLAEFTVSGHGVEIRFRPVSPGWVIEPERARIAALPRAKTHDPSDPREYVRWLEGETGAMEFETR